MMRPLVLVAFLCMVAATAKADRPVTDAERQKLVPTVAAQGCSGGKMQWDDGRYEVDDATCRDGRKYDLKFDAQFRLIKKELED